MKDPVKDKLKRFELFECFGDLFYPTVGAAVDAYLEEETPWTGNPETAAAVPQTSDGSDVGKRGCSDVMRMGSLIVGLALVAVGIADAADALPLVVDPAWVEATSGARELWPLTRTTETLVLSGAARMPYADAMQMGLQVGRSRGGNANLIASLVFESWARTDRTPRRPRHGAVGRVPPLRGSRHRRAGVNRDPLSPTRWEPHDLEGSW